jgi:molecular chaperone DnaK
VATNRHWVTGGGDILAAGVAVTGVHLPDNPRVDLALLRTAGPVGRGSTGHAVPRLGHARLVHVGDRVAGPDGEGLVDGFESFPDEGLRLIRTGLSVPPAGSGGPVVNDLGEVIGVLTVGDRDTGGAFAITVDALTGLMQSSS